MKFSGVLRVNSQFILTVLAILCELALSGDPCPGKDTLLPCTCTQVPVALENNMNMEKGVNNKLSADMHSQTPRLAKMSFDFRGEANVIPPDNTKNPHTTALGNDTFYTIVNCTMAKSISALEEAVRSGLHRKWVDKLIISHLPPEKEHTLAQLPAGLLKNLRVTQFEISDTLLAGDFIFKGNPFEGQGQNLVWFTATNCFLTGSLTFNTLGTTHTQGLNILPRVEGVDLSKNHLVYIQSTAFKYPPTNLSVVNLSHNDIQVIDSTTFHLAHKLKYVNFSHNLLVTIVRGIFAAPAKNLQNIDFSWNSLTTIPVDFFTNMPVLKMVNLESNFLYTLSEKPWAAVWKQLKFIQLTGNFLECDCELLWLVKIETRSSANKTVPGQTLLGSCGHTEPQLYKIQNELALLTREKLNCD